MRASAAAFVGVAMHIAAQPQPPQLLQIYHEAVRPGSEAVYSANEEDTARACVRLRCPHPYLGAESMTGPKEGWFFNSYESIAEQRQVDADYKKNRSIMDALLTNSKRKASFTSDPFDVVASYRKDLSRGAPWTLGQGRFLVITITKSAPKTDGAVFEAPDGTFFIIRATNTRAEADALRNSESTVLAVRPQWSFADKNWIALDRSFWQRD